MKTNYLFLAMSILLSACSTNEEKEEDLIQKCEDPRFILELTEDIQATVLIVQEGQSFFHGIKTYYEVDAEVYLPEIFEQNDQKIIRIFPTSRIDRQAGDKVDIKGTLSACLTGHHGLLTNDYKGFYILEE